VLAEDLFMVDANDWGITVVTATKVKADWIVVATRRATELNQAHGKKRARETAVADDLVGEGTEVWSGRICEEKNRAKVGLWPAVGAVASGTREEEGPGAAFGGPATPNLRWRLAEGALVGARARRLHRSRLQ
jgi:hypothetical protein